MHQNQLTSIPIEVCEANLLAELRAEGNPLQQPPIEECLDPLTKVSDLELMLKWHHEAAAPHSTVKTLDRRNSEDGSGNNQIGGAG